MTMGTPSPDTPLPPESRRKTNRALRLAKSGLRGLAWAVTILLAAVLLALACSQLIQWLFGDVAGYRQWAANHRGALQAWRLGLYATLVAGWWPLRQRLRRLPGGPARLARCECLAIIVIALYELRLHL